MFSVALDIISESLFGEQGCWNALEDYSVSNTTAWSLSELMIELHWRINDFLNTEYELHPESACFYMVTCFAS